MLLALFNGKSFSCGSDSSSALATAKRIVANPFYKPPKPWALSTNGDLWEVFQRHLQQFGSTFLSFDKVKGHATDQDVSDGKVSQWDKLGNDESDKYAGEATDLYGPNVPHLAKAYAYNHELFQIITMHIHTLLVTMYNEYNQLRIQRKELAFAHGEQLETVFPCTPKLPPSPGWDAGDQVDPVSLPLKFFQRVIN